MVSLHDHFGVLLILIRPQKVHRSWRQTIQHWFPFDFLHFSPFFTPPHDSLSYLIFQSLDYLFCFLHPHGLSSPAYVLCWWPFLFLFCLSSQLIIFLLKVPLSDPFSPHHLPISSSSTPCGLCPCLRITSVIRRWSSTLIIRVLMCFWSAILDQLSPLTSDIAHHLSFSYVRFISYLLTPPIWSRPARSVLLTTWSEGRIIDRITAFSPNYQY